MSDADRKRSEVLSDSEATLRQVEDVLSEIDGINGSRGPPPSGDDASAASVGLPGLVQVLARTYAEVQEVIDKLRESRGLIEKAAMDRLASTHRSLEEVSTATEAAATSMLDGLDRALVLVDRLESEEALRDEGERRTVREELREELHGVMHHLQFQDITAQQLGYAVGVLLDLEERMRRLTGIFGMQAGGVDPVAPVAPVAPDGAVVHDPRASTLRAPNRQAVADQIFMPPRSG